MIDEAIYTHQFIQWRHGNISLNGKIIFSKQEGSVNEFLSALYVRMKLSYPKFYKMDVLSKSAYLASEIILKQENYDGDRNEVATIISTAEGCIDVDRKFEQSRKDIASPALFVYTLPNIMLGEICIRHKFKGAQLCTVFEKPNIPFLHFVVSDLFQNRNTTACLCGFVDADEQEVNLTLFWVGKEKRGIPFTIENLKKHFDN